MNQEQVTSLQPGMWVALALKEGAAPARGYVGQVQSVDERGVRITRVDWISGTASDWDFFAPWDQITSALIATPEHNIAAFGESADSYIRHLDTKKSAGERPVP
jgi:hypothetical protein